MTHNFRSRIFSLVGLICGIIFIIASLLFAGVLVLFSLPFIGLGLYHIIKIKRHFKNIKIVNHTEPTNVIEAKKWKVIENKDE